MRELLRNIETVDIRAPLDAEISGVASDSRKTAPGNAFICVRGFESDGHDYIAEAVSAGASVIISEEPPEAEIPFVLVPNSRTAMQIAALNWYGDPAASMSVIGVTGTNGKTTVTELLKRIIEHATGAKTGLIGTVHDLVGEEELPAQRTTPDALELQALLRRMADAGCRYVVMEVSSHALALERVRGIRFKTGVFTNLTEDHLDFHGTMEDYAAAKAKLFSMSETSVINMDDAASELMKRSAAGRVFTYSTRSDEADLTAKSIRLKPDGVCFCALTTGRLEKLRLGIPGMFSVYNALAAASAALTLGIGLEDVRAAFADFKGVRGRMEVVPTGRDFNVIIDYAHTPDALENALDTLRESSDGKLITVFGCGGDRESQKRPMMGRAAGERSDYVIVTSDNPRTEDPAAIIRQICTGLEDGDTPYEAIEDRRRAIARALSMAGAGDTVLLAGKGHESYQIIGREARHFDEREVVREILLGSAIN